MESSKGQSLLSASEHSTLTAVMHFPPPRRLLAATGIALLLASCGSSADEERTDLESTLDAMQEQVEETEARPSALLGVFISHYLSGVSSVTGANSAIDIQLNILFGDEREQSETFALLEELGALLQIDVIDMLNRNPERRAALDTYIERLTDTYKQTVVRLELLEQQEDEAQELVREKRRRSAEINRSLNEALRDQDYGTAGSMQQLLIGADKEESEAKAKQDEIRGTIKLVEDLVEIAEDRLIAIDQNREILISGLKLVDVPGIDDLGIVKDLNRAEREEAGNIFGPTGN